MDTNGNTPTAPAPSIPDAYLNQVQDDGMPVEAQPASPSAEPEKHDDQRAQGSESDNKQEDDLAELSGSPDKLLEEVKRNRTNLSAVMKERDELKKKHELTETNLNKLATWAAKKPENYIEAFMEVNGATREQAEAEVARLRAQGAWADQNQPQQPAAQPTTPQTPAQPSQPQVDPFTAARVVVNQELERREATTALIEAYPELKETNATNDARFKEAFYMAQAWINANPTTTLKDALLKQYGVVSGKTADQVQEALKTGRIEGIAAANAARSATGGEPVAKTTQQSNVNLSAEDKERAAKLGMSEEKYYQRKNETVTMVDE